jgi:hypothetical protein
MNPGTPAGLPARRAGVGRKEGQSATSPVPRSRDLFHRVRGFVEHPHLVAGCFLLRVVFRSSRASDRRRISLSRSSDSESIRRSPISCFRFCVRESKTPAGRAFP